MRFSIIARVILLIKNITLVFCSKDLTLPVHIPHPSQESFKFPSPSPPLPLAQMKGSNACGLLEGRDIEASN